MANTTRPSVSSNNNSNSGSSKQPAAQQLGRIKTPGGRSTAAGSMDSNSDLANGNLILLRSAQTNSTAATAAASGGQHFVLRAKYPLAAAVSDHVVSCNRQGRQIVLQQQQSGGGEGVFSFHSVKRFGTGTPILLLSSAGSHDGTPHRIGRHFIVQTTGGNQNPAVNTLTCINPRTTARLKVQMAQHQQQQQQQQEQVQVKLENGQQGFGVQSQDGGASRSNSQTPIGSDGEPIKLPENLESLPRSDHFPNQRHRWNTNEEIAAILISFDRHTDWQSKEVKIRPKSGSMLLYSRKKVRYRRDGYCWKKRKDGKTTREDHMKLKVQGTECIYGCYVHSAILPTFHRRCYWLLQNPDIVLVHYLNVPYPDDTKMAVITPSLALWTDKKEWTKDELVSQLKPMFFSEDEPDLNNELEISTAETVDAIVSQLMEKQRIARQAALVKQLECGCPDSTCADGKTCSHPMRRITSAAASKLTDSTAGGGVGGVASNRGSDGSAGVGALPGDGGRGNGARPPSRSESSNNQVSSTTGSSPIQINNNTSNHATPTTTLLHPHSTQQPPRVYTRSDRIHQHNSAAAGTTQYVHISQQQSGLHHHPHNNGGGGGGASSNGSNNTPPLVLSLSQIQNGNGGGLIILNKAGGSGGELMGGGGSGGGGGGGSMTVAGFVCNGRKEDYYTSGSSTKEILNMQQNVLKQEAMDTTNQSSSISLYTNLTTIINNNGGNDNQNGKQHSQATLLNHSDGFLSRQRQYQSDVARSATPSMSSKINNTNHDNMSNTSSSSTPSNNIFLDHHHHAKQPQQVKLSPINIKLPPEQLHTEPAHLTLNIHHHNQQQQQQHYFNNHETLDLSQEDIQRTLSANMPMAGGVLEVVESSGVVGARRSGAQAGSAGVGSVMVIRGIDLGDGGIGKVVGGVGGRHQQQQQHGVQHGQHHEQVLSPEISSMDFIDPCDEVASSPNVVDDDVFVNLDAFDMLGEFPDLEVLDPVGHSTLLEANTCGQQQQPSDHHDPATAVSATSDLTNAITARTQQHSNTATSNSNSNNLSVHNNDSEAIVKITDYSPEWAYPDGGVKVLVTGPWQMTRSGGYTVLFDAFPVPTTLVQSGVLRCYCPAHEAGLATLQVACDGYVISNSVIFEYKLPQKEEHGIYALEPKVERSNDNLLKFTLLQRLEAMDERLQIKKEPVDGNDLVEDSVLFSKPNLEDRLVTYCQRLTARLWRHGEELSVDWFASHRGMTLLHLAASLGYSRLVCAILHWRAENSSLLLETEVDALSQDEYGYTPLMWACVKGHTDTAVMLYKWNHTALNVPNHLGQSALECARMNGYHGLGKSLERLENKREKANQMLLLLSTTNTGGATNGHGLAGASHAGGVSKGLNGGGEADGKAADGKDAGGGAKASTVSSSSSGTISPAGSVTSLASVASTSRSHDGVFLRPGAVTRSETVNQPKYKSSLNLDLDSITSNSPSPSSADLYHPSAANKHLLLSGAPSPLLSDGCSSLYNQQQQQQTSNNGNGRDRSCFGQRLSKRTSFDSGIHLNQSAENVSPKPVFRGAGWKLLSGGGDKLTTRFTRSMSLPLQHSTLSQEVEQSFNNYGDSSGLKKMDFALCEVVTMTQSGQSKRGGSPLIDVEAVSSGDEENDQEHDVAGAGGATADVGTAVSGDQDVRVLTLAEQIIAAIPDHIKNESEDMLLESPSSVAMLHSNDMLSDVLMEPLFDQSSSSFESSDVFEFSDYNYRYYDVATPCSSLSPAPSSCLQSPRSFTLDSPSPPPTTADFCEFFQASGGIFEKDFSNLTLSDREQRELYEAAKIIQKAYRSYKGRQQQEQNKERAAAILIQNYYRRYKQYAYFKQMTHAAMVIQNGFRSYCEHKRFKKSKEAALCIQNYYRNYKEQGSSQCSSSNIMADNMNSNGSGSTSLKRTYSQRRQHQAARKIQQFMRQSKNKLQRERAEKEKQLDQLVDVLPLQRLLCPEDNSASPININR